jgi:hypothetical protein
MKELRIPRILSIECTSSHAMKSASERDARLNPYRFERGIPNVRGWRCQSSTNVTRLPGFEEIIGYNVRHTHQTLSRMIASCGIFRLLHRQHPLLRRKRSIEAQTHPS